MAALAFFMKIKVLIDFHLAFLNFNNANNASTGLLAFLEVKNARFRGCSNSHQLGASDPYVGQSFMKHCSRCGRQEGAINVNMLDHMGMTLCFECAADLAEQLLTALIAVYAREASELVM